MPKNEIKNIPEFTEENPKAPQESQVPEKQEVPETPPPSTEVKEEVKEEPKEEPKEALDNREEQGLENELQKIKGENQRTVELRQEIVGERKKRRELRKEESTQEPETADDLSDIDEESRKTIDRVIKAGGYVKGDEAQKIAYKSAHAQAEQSFYITHPEYTEDQDTDDALYNALQDELKNFATPQDSSGIPVLFEKAHSLVKQRFPSRFESGEPESPSSNQGKKDISSMGGPRSGAAPSNTEPQAKLTPQQVEKFRSMGWSEADIQELNT